MPCRLSVPSSLAGVSSRGEDEAAKPPTLLQSAASGNLWALSRLSGACLSTRGRCRGTSVLSPGVQDTFAMVRMLRYSWPDFVEPEIPGGRIQSSEIKVSGFGNVAGMPGGVTGSAVSNLGLAFFVAGDVVPDPGGELRKLFLA